MNVYEQRLIRWREITLARKYFNGSCFLCKKSIITNRKRPYPHTKISFVGFVYHHKQYFEGDPRRKNYPPGSAGTWPYKRDLLPFVERYHNEFLLLDKGCHKILESVIIKARKYPPFTSRLSLGVDMTDTARGLVRAVIRR